MEQLLNDKKIKEIRYVDNGDSWLFEEDHFDLLLTALRTHYSN